MLFGGIMSIGSVAVLSEGTTDHSIITFFFVFALFGLAPFAGGLFLYRKNKLQGGTDPHSVTRKITKTASIKKNNLNRNLPHPTKKIDSKQVITVFRVVLTGQIKDGYNLPQVTQSLSNLFKVDIKTISKLFDKAPSIVKGDINEQLAVKYKLALEKCGVVCVIVENKKQIVNREQSETNTATQKKDVKVSPKKFISSLTPLDIVFGTFWGVSSYYSIEFHLLHNYFLINYERVATISSSKQNFKLMLPFDVISEFEVAHETKTSLLNTLFGQGKDSAYRKIKICFHFGIPFRRGSGSESWEVSDEFSFSVLDTEWEKIGSAWTEWKNQHVGSDAPICPKCGQYSLKTKSRTSLVKGFLATLSYNMVDSFPKTKATCQACNSVFEFDYELGCFYSPELGSKASKGSMPVRSNSNANLRKHIYSTKSGSKISKESKPLLSNNEASSQRPIGFLLGIGIFFMPYVFSWFLLRKGHSKISRFIGFFWLVLIAFSLINVINS